MKPQSVSQITVNNIGDVNSIIDVTCHQYQTISQLQVGECEVSDDDEEMLMTLLLFNEMEE